MKKSIALVILAALAIPSSAMALQNATRGVIIAGGPAGTTVSNFKGLKGLDCLYNLTWTSPAGGLSATNCDVLERSVFGTVCNPTANVNLPVVGGDGFTICNGFLPNAVTPEPVVLLLQEFNTVNPTLGGVALFPSLAGLALAIQM